MCIASDDAKYFIESHQQQEFVYEAFIRGLISQADFYPINPDLWLEMACWCNFNDPAILDNRLNVNEGGPVADWYIYPKLLKWLVANKVGLDVLHFSDTDMVFLHYDLPLERN